MPDSKSGASLDLHMSALTGPSLHDEVNDDDVDVSHDDDDSIHAGCTS